MWLDCVCVCVCVCVCERGMRANFQLCNCVCPGAAGGDRRGDWTQHDVPAESLRQLVPRRPVLAAADLRAQVQGTYPRRFKECTHRGSMGLPTEVQGAYPLQFFVRTHAGSRYVPTQIKVRTHTNEGAYSQRCKVRTHSDFGTCEQRVKCVPSQGTHPQVCQCPYP